MMLRIVASPRPLCSRLIMACPLLCVFPSCHYSLSSPVLPRKLLEQSRRPETSKQLAILQARSSPAAGSGRYQQTYFLLHSAKAIHVVNIISMSNLTAMQTSAPISVDLLDMLTIDIVRYRV